MNSNRVNDEFPDEHPVGESDPELPIRLAGSNLVEERHICAFFGTPEEEYRVLLPFIKEGLERGERAVHIVDPQLREEHLRLLEAAGLDVESIEKEGHFELYDWDEFYFRDGRFDEARLFSEWEDLLEGAVHRGYPRTRVIAHVDWNSDDSETLLQYEAKFNLSPRHRDPVICIYDLSKHSSAFLIDVMRTHPMMIVGGVLQENPFYVQPQVFIEELTSRRRASQASADAAG